MFDIFTQALGFIGIGLNILAVQFNTHKKIMVIKTIAEMFFAIHYLCLGAYTGMIMDLIGTLRNIIFTYRVAKGKSNKWAIVFFSVFTIVVGFITSYLSFGKTLESMQRWTTNTSLMIALAIFVCTISIVAKFLTTVGYGIKNPHSVRWLNFPSSACWLFYNSICFSISGAINEVLVMTSIIIAEIRFRKKPQEKIAETENDESIDNIDKL